MKIMCLSDFTWNNLRSLSYHLPWHRCLLSLWKINPCPALWLAPLTPASETGPQRLIGAPWIWGSFHDSKEPTCSLTNFLVSVRLTEVLFWIQINRKQGSPLTDIFTTSQKIEMIYSLILHHSTQYLFWYRHLISYWFTQHLVFLCGYLRWCQYGQNNVFG